MDRPAHLEKRLELLITDANGVPRGKTIDSESFEEDNPPRLAEAVLFQCIHGSYAEATMDDYNPKDEDFILAPDWSTYRRTAWKDDSVGQVICEALDKEGEPLPYDTRNVLRRVLKAYEARGLTPIIAPEIEFYLLTAPKRGDQALEPGSGVDGRDEFGGEAFSFDALDRYAPFVTFLQEAAEAAELSISAILHEVGAGQMEINVDHGPALEVADQLVLMKRLVKGCAVEHGYLASFMAKTSLKSLGQGCISIAVCKILKGSTCLPSRMTKPLRNCVTLLAAYKNTCPKGLPFLRQTSTVTSGLPEIFACHLMWSGGTTTAPRDSVCLMVLPRTVALKCALLAQTPIPIWRFL